MKTAISCCGFGKGPVQKEPLDARIDQEDIKTVYDRIAPVYDIWGRLTESRARNRAIELADIRDGQTILEVAVGTGLAFHELVRRNPNGESIGIDLSPGMLEKARKRLRAIPDSTYSLAPGTAFRLELEANAVDLVMNNYMFDLIPFKDMDRILKEFRRVLKPGGKLVLVNMTRGETFGSRIYDRVYRLSPGTMGGCRGVKLSERIARNGFTVGRREYFQQMLFPSEVILAYKLGTNSSMLFPLSQFPPTRPGIGA
jgi:ubiquinone/menaquinone biosynthesis C-methylase UbiE